MTIVRNPTYDDIMSATRGLELMKLTDGELTALVERHSPIDVFASKVIVMASERLLGLRRVIDETHK